MIMNPMIVIILSSNILFLTQNRTKMDSDSQLFPLKQTTLTFHPKTKPTKHQRQKKTHSVLQINYPEKCQELSKQHSALQPRLPSKKLFQEPRFFMSLQKKKDRILGGFKKIRDFCNDHQLERKLQGSKVKEQRGSLSKRNQSDLYLSDPKIEQDRRGWVPNPRTPLLNFNMHYLIRKRKSMTTVVDRQEHTLYQTLNSSRL